MCNRNLSISSFWYDFANAVNLTAPLHSPISCCCLFMRLLVVPWFMCHTLPLVQDLCSSNSSFRIDCCPEGSFSCLLKGPVILCDSHKWSNNTKLMRSHEGKLGVVAQQSVSVYPVLSQCCPTAQYQSYFYFVWQGSSQVSGRLTCQWLLQARLNNWLDWGAVMAVLSLFIVTLYCIHMSAVQNPLTL